MGKTFCRGTLNVLAVAAFLSSALIAQTLGGGSRSAAARITQEIDETRLIGLPGNVHPAARVPALDRGPVAESFPMGHMLLQLKRSTQQEKALAVLMDQLHTPGNPHFHRWLTEAAFDESFGINQEDVSRVVAWLRSHGFKVSGVTPDGMVIDFSGTAAMVRSAFHTQIDRLQTKNGAHHIANMSDPEIPEALADVVVGPTALHDFMPHPNSVHRNSIGIDAQGQMHKRERISAGGKYTFAGCNGPCYAFTPGDAQVIYNITPLLASGYTGKGSTIAVVENEDAYNSSGGTAPDWTAFMSSFGLTSYGGSQTTEHPSGSLSCTDPGDPNDGGDFEVELDTEYASATAPGANVVIAACSDTTTAFGGIIAVENLVSAATITAPVISMSYGYCEAANGANNNMAYSTAFQHAVARGISVFVSSGDESSRSCDAGESDAVHGLGISGFTSTPYNVSVGGTDFGDTYTGTNSTYWSNPNSATYESALSYVPEIAWNDSCASDLIFSVEGYAANYGSDGFCNSAAGIEDFITTTSGSGGASNCYSGASSVTGVASGTCMGQPKPSWQSVYGNPADGVRDIPDVSLFAANGVWSHFIVLCYSNLSQPGSAPCTGAPDTWSGAGGTSASSPMLAGIQTLINQYIGESAGNPNYVYYNLAAKEYGINGSSNCNSSNGVSGTGSCIFYDVTQGDINVPCAYYSGSTAYNCYDTSPTLYGVGSLTNSSYDPTYMATGGWDFATGIGTVNAYNLATNWTTAAEAASTSTELTIMPNPVAAGVNVSLSATVTTATGTATGGTVTFKANGNSFLTCPLVDGVCSVSNLNTNGIPIETYSITATYGGTASFSSSTSSAVNATLAKSTTTTTVGVALNAVTPRATATLTATVERPADSQGIPTGTVTFYANGALLGTSTVGADGRASFSHATPGVTSNSYTVSAIYSGDSNDRNSTGTTKVNVD
jgi:subtilase family serine protease